jgi:uncharacterized membrane protein YhhN
LAVRTWAGRLALAAAVVGGVSYLAADHLTLSQPISLAWKGAGVGFLALYAALAAQSLDGWLICAVMALGAAGDVLLGAAGFTVGGAAFFGGHVAAIVLYQRNRREGLGWPWLAAAALIAGTVGAAILLPADRAAAPAVGIYAAGLSYMAASAWLSRFPRGVAIGDHVPGVGPVDLRPLRPPGGRGLGRVRDLEPLLRRPGADRHRRGGDAAPRLGAQA